MISGAANFHWQIPHGSLMIGWSVLLVLSSPAAAHLADSGVKALGDTCEADEGFRARCFIQREQSAKAAQVLLADEGGKTFSANSQNSTGGGTQQSIFALPVSKINAGNFWLVVSGMLLFTVAVDRGQAYLESLAEGSERRQALLARMNSELVMFGVVAVCLFVVTNLITIESTLFLQVEYVDILCSLTCIFLMSIVATYFAIFTSLSGEWQAYEDKKLREDEVPLGIGMDAATYKALAQEFKERHQLPDGFVFLVYLRECFVLDCCDIMNVRWYMWVLLMVFSIGFYFMRGTYGTKMSDSDYLLVMSILFLMLFFTFAVVASVISHSYSLLVKSAPEVADGIVKRASGLKELAMESDDDLPRNELTHFLLQLLAVVNAFLSMHFVMNELHIISAGHVSALWYLTCVPLLLNFFILLPVSLMRMSFVDAYHNSNRDALDAVITELNRLDGDKRYVKMLWDQKGRPKPKLEGEVGYKDFRDVLLKEELNLYCNEQRAKRLFAAFDLDGNGSVNVDEFLSVLSGKISESSFTAAQKANIFVNIQ